MKNRILGIIGVVSVTAFLTMGCGNAAEPEPLQTQAATEVASAETELQAEAGVLETETETETEDPYAVPEGQVRSYLTGKAVDEEIGRTRPYAIMLNNIYGAVPQAGIEQADVVYEAPVEGAITRLMGIFEDYAGMEKIGSIRSCREYYVHFANEFNAIYVHYGQAVYACEILNTKIDNISGLASQEGFGKLYGYAGESTFYRSSDRPSPHNVYTTADDLISATQNLCYSRDYDENYEGHYQFAADDETITLDNTATTMRPGYETCKPWFEYDADLGVYRRYEYGDAQIDQLNGDQLKYENVIFQLCETYALDQKGYLAIETEGSGKAYYFTKGTYEECTWERDDYDGRTVYYDSDGEEITMNQGKTWVCVQYSSKEDQIEIE